MDMDMQKTLHTTATVRGDLLADLAALRAGDLRPSDARTRAYVAKQVIDTLKIEVVAANMRVQGFEPLQLIAA